MEDKRNFRYSQPLREDGVFAFEKGFYLKKGERKPEYSGGKALVTCAGFIEGNIEDCAQYVDLGYEVVD
jgi:hypothetical protein